MGFGDWIDSIKDTWNDGIEDKFKGHWDDFKNEVVDTVNDKTIGQLWDDFKDGAEDVFTKGCLAVRGSEDKTGCCKLNEVIKCSAKKLVEYGNDLSDLGGKAFQNGCEAIGGTVKSNDKWECDVDVEGEVGMQTYYGKAVSGSGSIATNVSIFIIIQSFESSKIPGKFNSIFTSIFLFLI